MSPYLSIDVLYKRLGCSCQDLIIIVKQGNIFLQLYAKFYIIFLNHVKIMTEPVAIVETSVALRYNPKTCCYNGNQYPYLGHSEFQCCTIDFQ